MARAGAGAQPAWLWAQGTGEQDSSVEDREDEAGARWAPGLQRCTKPSGSSWLAAALSDEPVLPSAGPGSGYAVCHGFKLHGKQTVSALGVPGHDALPQQHCSQKRLFIVQGGNLHPAPSCCFSALPVLGRERWCGSSASAASPGTRGRLCQRAPGRARCSRGSWQRGGLSIPREPVPPALAHCRAAGHGAPCPLLPPQGKPQPQAGAQPHGPGTVASRQQDGRGALRLWGSG